MTEQDGPSLRSRVLIALLCFQLPLAVLREKLRELPWDSSADQVKLTPAHVLHVLSECKAGKIDLADVSAWAELIESREDIGLSARAADDLRAFIFEAANPEINVFGPERYQVWVDKLSVYGD
jgi:hypothetical protein